MNKEEAYKFLMNYHFERATSGLLTAIREACDPAVSEWRPYRGDCHAWAAYHARVIVAHARRLGLIQSDEPITGEGQWQARRGAA